MKLSEKNKSALYEAISEPMMQKRILIQKADGMLHRKDVDELLFKLTSEIWREVHSALNLEGNP